MIAAETVLLRLREKLEAQMERLKDSNMGSLDAEQTICVRAQYREVKRIFSEVAMLLQEIREE